MTTPDVLGPGFWPYPIHETPEFREYKAALFNALIGWRGRQLTATAAPQVCNCRTQLVPTGTFYAAVNRRNPACSIHNDGPHLRPASPLLRGVSVMRVEFDEPLPWTVLDDEERRGD